MRRRTASRGSGASTSGLHFYRGKSRRGKFLLKRKTRRTACGRSCKPIKQELRQRSHQADPVQEMAEKVVKGLLQLSRLPTTVGRWCIRFFVTELWQRMLRRRSRRRHDLQQITQLAKIGSETDTLHPWPKIRFRRYAPRWERMRETDVRFCAGAPQNERPTRSLRSQ